MDESPLPYIYEGCRIWSDGQDVLPEMLNPSLSSIDLVLEDRKKFVGDYVEDLPRDFPNETKRYGHWIGVYKDLNAGVFNSALKIETIIEEWKTYDVVTLSSLDSEMVFFIDKGTFFDNSALKNLIVRFLDGEDIIQTFPFELQDKESAKENPRLANLLLDVDGDAAL
jgi:hypothetical protein